MLIRRIPVILIIATPLLAFWFACQSPQLQVVYQSNKSDTATQLGDPQMYYLKKKAIHADFPYNKLDDLNSAFDKLKVTERASVFSPVVGQYNYYQFLSTFRGERLVFPGENLPPIIDFHDILIIKTDDEDHIIDAYHYTTEWAEYPLDYDLFRLSQTGLLLKDGLDIQDLKLKRIFQWSTSDKDKYLNASGSLKLPTVK